MGTLAMAAARSTPTFVALVLFTVPYLVAAQSCTDCFESGRCLGTLLTTAVRNSDCDCQTACSDINGCSDFTFDSTTGICSLMLSCTSKSNCSTCASGPATCPVASTTTAATTTSPSGSVCSNCFDAGRCTGTLITTTITGTDCQCQDFCAGTAGCTDFTFDSTNGICSVM